MKIYENKVTRCYRTDTKGLWGEISKVANKYFCAYIYFRINIIPKHLQYKFINVTSLDSNIPFPNVNGEISYYSKRIYDETPVHVIGWDYAHDMDREDYEFRDIEKELFRVLEEFNNMIMEC